jgi:hypothetical protein
VAHPLLACAIVSEVAETGAVSPGGSPTGRQVGGPALVVAGVVLLPLGGGASR